MADLTVLTSPNPLYPRLLGTTQSAYDLRSPPDNDSANASVESITTTSPFTSSVRQYPGTTLLSPPVNTFKSRPRSRSRRRETRGHQRRSSSAPPLPSLDTSLEPSRTRPAPATARPACRKPLPPPRRWTTPALGAFDLEPISLPPPPLFRPTTFWRNTPRSGVQSAAYSPSSHLIRRSTFIAAGLDLEKPVADMSAMGVESRVSPTVMVAIPV